MGGRGLGGFLLDGGLADRAAVALVQGGQGVVFRFVGGVYVLPAVYPHHLACGLEQVPLAFGDDFDGVVLVGGIKHRDEPPGDHVKQLLRVGGQLVYRRSLGRGDDGVMVGNFFVVENALGNGQLAALPPGDVFHVLVVLPWQLMQRLHRSADHIHGKIPAVGAGVGDGLPFFVKLLGDFQRLVGGKAQLAVGLPL